MIRFVQTFDWYCIEKCDIGMQTQNVIHFNFISDMVQVSSFLTPNHVCEVYTFTSKYICVRLPRISLCDPDLEHCSIQYE
jgi:hypothetical protein